MYCRRYVVAFDVGTVMFRSGSVVFVFVSSIDVTATIAKLHNKEFRYTYVLFIICSCGDNEISVGEIGRNI
jgi:hypothetical protein